MSILDTFTILFNSNSKEVEEGAEKATKAGEKLEQTLGKTGETGKNAAHEIVHANEEAASSFDKIREHSHRALESIIEQTVEASLAWQSLIKVEELLDSVFEQAEKTDQLGETARSLGLDVSEIDAWGQAVKHVGGTAEGFTESLKQVEYRLQRVTLMAAHAKGGSAGGDRSSLFFKALGIDPKTIKTSFDLLDQIPKKIEGMDKAKSGALLRGIGLDEGTIRLMQSGSKEVKELVEHAKELGTITTADTEVAEKFNRQWMDVKQLFRDVVIATDSFLLPILGDLLHAVEDFVMFLREHKDLVIGFFIGLVTALVAVADVMGLVDFAFLLNPVVLLTAAIGALIAAFAFLYDDIINFAEGNNSVIGELAKRWPIVGEAVRGLIVVFEDVKNFLIEAFTEILTWIERIPEGIRQWEELFNIVEVYVSQFVDKLEGYFNMLPEPIKAAFSEIAEIAKIVFGGMAEAAKAGFSVINVAVNAFYEFMKAVLTLVANLIVDPEHAFQKFGETIKQIVTSIVGTMPALTQAFANVGKAFEGIAAGIIKLWHDISDIVGGTIGKIAGAIGSIGTWMHNRVHAHDAEDVHRSRDDGPAAITDDVHRSMEAARIHLDATRTPLLAETPVSLSAAGAGAGSMHQTVTVNAPATINTTSSDPQAIKDAFDQHLSSQIDSALNHLADGVSH